MARTRVVHCKSAFLQAYRKAFDKASLDRLFMVGVVDLDSLMGDDFDVVVDVDVDVDVDPEESDGGGDMEDNDDDGEAGGGGME